MAKKLFNQTPEFKKLQAEWAQKLADSGFQDIEKGELDTVIRPQIIKTQKNQYIGGTDYFTFCQEILRLFRFKKEIHRIIFSLHSEGMSERDICQRLKQNQRVTFSQKGINLIIHRVKEQYLKGNK
jgi:hypothetical protein